MTWTGNASGSTGPYQYTWSGTDGLSGNTQSLQYRYTTQFTKTATLSVTSAKGEKVTATCVIEIAEPARAATPVRKVGPRVVPVDGI